MGCCSSADASRPPPAGPGGGAKVTGVSAGHAPSVKKPAYQTAPYGNSTAHVNGDDPHIVSTTQVLRTPLTPLAGPEGAPAKAKRSFSGTIDSITSSSCSDHTPGAQASSIEHTEETKTQPQQSPVRHVRIMEDHRVDKPPSNFGRHAMTAPDLGDEVPETPGIEKIFYASAIDILASPHSSEADDEELNQTEYIWSMPRASPASSHHWGSLTQVQGRDAAGRCIVRALRRAVSISRNQQHLTLTAPTLNWLRREQFAATSILKAEMTRSSSTPVSTPRSSWGLGRIAGFFGMAGRKGELPTPSSVLTPEETCREAIEREEGLRRFELFLRTVVIPSRARTALALEMLPATTKHATVAISRLLVVHRGIRVLWLQCMGALRDPEEVFAHFQQAIAGWDARLLQGLALCEERLRSFIVQHQERSFEKRLDRVHDLLQLNHAESVARYDIRIEEFVGRDFILEVRKSRKLPYEPVRFLGRGAQGELTLVKNRQGELFAMKEMVMASPDELARNYAMARDHQRRLGHRNIVEYTSIHACIDNVGRPTLKIAMPYYSDGDLNLVIRKAQTRLAYTYILAIAVQLFDALAYLHSRRPPVVHRDIKPENILLTDSGTRVILLDFDISKPLLFSAIYSQGGTFQYTAPETLATSRTTPASDVFAAGVILYILACLPEFPMLAPPGEEDTMLLNSEKWSRDALESALRAEFARVNGKDPIYPKEFEDVVISLLDHDITLRLSAEKAAATFRDLLARATPP